MKKEKSNRMCKPGFAFLVFVMITAQLSAHPVDKGTAAIIARNVYCEHAAGLISKEVSSITVTQAYTESRDGENYFYVFNISAGGFVIISAEDAVWPVLGFSFKGKYTGDGLPPAFSLWMEDYVKQMQLVRERKQQADDAVQAEWQRLSRTEKIPARNVKSVSPLLYTHWDQGKYFNEYCPVDSAGPGDHAWAGCVPTAMAQIMNYWRWPLQGTGSYSYTDSTYGVLSADFANTTYRWNEMPAVLTAYNSAIAELLFHLGVSVDLKYGPNGSGMYNHKAAYALRTHFGYSANTEYVFRDTCTLNWKAIVLAHLDNEMPLYYAGWADTINESGHAFVCDGYQDTNYFHMNWGWGGSYNGYFLLDNLTPGGADFTLDHELIINIYPDGAYPYYCTGTDTLSILSSVIDDGSGPVNDYGNNADCRWLIAPDDSVVNIKLRFLRFDLHTSDTLFVHNGGSETDPVLAKLTGSNLPSLITCTKKQLLLRFVSDDSLTAGGFLVKDSTAPVVFCSGTTMLSAMSGSLHDGSGTFNYHNNSTCKWNVQPPGATAITVHFNSFDLNAGDFVRITNLENGQMLAHFTGDSLPDDLVCLTSKFQILFRADPSHTAGGWSLDYFVSSGLTEYNELAALEVFPNPATDYFMVSGTLEFNRDVRIEILNSAMQKVSETIVVSPTENIEVKIPTGEMHPGIYFLRMTTAESILVKKIMIL